MTTERMTLQEKHNRNFVGIFTVGPQDFVDPQIVLSAADYVFCQHTKISVVDLLGFNADLGPDPVFYLDADPDPGSQTKADPCRTRS